MQSAETPPPATDDQRSMRRWTVGALLLLVVALATVLVLVVRLAQRDRAALLEQFAAERYGLVREASRGIANALDDVGDDLHLAAELVGQDVDATTQQRELRALLEAVGQLKALCVVGADGAPRFTLVDRRAGQEVQKGNFNEVMVQTARDAMALPPGTVVTSLPLGEPPGGWYRVFATSLPATALGNAGGAVAVLADTEPFFVSLKVVTSLPSSRLMLLGAHGLPAPATDSLLAKWVGKLSTDDRLLPQFASLIARMRAGEEGQLRIGEDEAEQLGLGRAEAVVAFAQVAVKAGRHWSVATLDSTTALRTHEMAIALRFGLAAALVAIFLTAFGAWVVIASRRTVALRERLKHAARLAHLHDKTQKILDNIPTGVLALSAAGHVTAVNRALGELLAGTVLGMDLAQAFSRAPPTPLCQRSCRLLISPS